MHADHAVDDELEPGETDAAVRQRREIEGTVRVAHVHHDLHRCRRQRIELDLLTIEIERAVVDETGVALGAGHRDRLSLAQHARGIAASDHRGDAELARDDRRVAGAATAVGDDRCCALHHRLPVRVGHVGDQHIAGLDARHLRRVGDDAAGTGTDPLTDAAAFDEHRGALLQGVALQRPTCAALDGLGTRLQDEKFTRRAVFAPFDVHGTPVMVLDDERLASELDEIAVCEAETVAFCGGYLHRTNAFRGARFAVDHLDGLGAEVAPQHRATTGAQGGLVEVELVRVHGALHHGLAEPPRGRDEHGVAEAGVGVEREHHAARAEIGAHHALDAGGQRHLGVVVALVDAVGDRAVVEERGEDLLHRLDHRGPALDVQEGLLLTGERGVR